MTTSSGRHNIIRQHFPYQWTPQKFTTVNHGQSGQSPLINKSLTKCRQWKEIIPSQCIQQFSMAVLYSTQRSDMNYIYSHVIHYEIFAQWKNIVGPIFNCPSDFSRSKKKYAPDRMPSSEILQIALPLPEFVFSTRLDSADHNCSILSGIFKTCPVQFPNKKANTCASLKNKKKKPTIFLKPLRNHLARLIQKKWIPYFIKL